MITGGIVPSVVTTTTRKYINPCMAPYNAQGNGTSDDTTPLLLATKDGQALQRKVILPAGTYKCSDLITDLTNPATLVIEGDDPDNTILQMAAGTWANGLINLTGAGLGTAQAVLAPTVIGANVITFTSTTGISANDVIYIVDSTQPIVGNAGRTTASLSGEFAQVKSVDSPTQVTVRERLDFAYTTSATVAKLNSQSSSLQGFAVRNLNPGTLPATARGIVLNYFRDIELGRLAFQDMDADCIYPQVGLDGTISGVRYLNTHDAETANNPYCIALAKACMQILVEHVRSRYGRHLITTAPATNYAAPAYIKIADSIATEHSESAFDCHPGTRKMTFENCESHASGTTGVTPNGFQIRGPDCEVLNCKATGQGAAGVSVIYGADRCRINGGRFSQCDTGVVIESSDDCFIGGDILIQSPVTNGINVIRDAAYAANMNIVTLGDLVITGSPTNLINDGTSGAVAIFESGRVRTPGAATMVSGGNVDTLWNPFRSSDVSTLPWEITVKNTVTMTSGTVFVAPAVVRETRTYTRIRFAVGTTAPGGTYTDCRAGVWNLAGTSKLADTGDLHATVIAANTVYTVNLGSSLSLFAGQVVQVGVGFIASTAPNLVGLVMPTGLAALAPLKGGSTAGWLTGTALPTTVTVNGNSATIVWAELLP
ncbi:MAG TPA: hypothetical protein VFI54_06275 [Solirubrobacteraceae bacterium]|nr:hypothetical protein [Solirubrobacteraceae bacterium]